MNMKLKNKKYYLNDPRYPKVICSTHVGAVHEKLKNPQATHYQQ